MEKLLKHDKGKALSLMEFFRLMKKKRSDSIVALKVLSSYKDFIKKFNCNETIMGKHRTKFFEAREVTSVAVILKQKWKKISKKLQLTMMKKKTNQCN